MVRGEARRPVVVTDINQADGHRVSDQGPEQSPALRQLADRRDGLAIHADVDELLERPVTADDSEGRVLGPGELAGRLDNPAQDGLQGQLCDDRAVGPQQSTEPVLDPDHLGRALHQLLQQPLDRSARRSRLAVRCPAARLAIGALHHH